MMSRRVLEVALLYSAGNSYQDIACMLEISPHTVHEHLRQAFRQTETHDQLTLAMWLCRNGGLHILHLLTVVTVNGQRTEGRADATTGR